MDYRCTELGVNSASHFPFGARTDRQTDRQTDRRNLTLCATPAAIQPAWDNESFPVNCPVAIVTYMYTLWLFCVCCEGSRERARGSRGSGLIKRDRRAHTQSLGFVRATHYSVLLSVARAVARCLSVRPSVHLSVTMPNRVVAGSPGQQFWSGRVMGHCVRAEPLLGSGQ